MARAASRVRGGLSSPRGVPDPRDRRRQWRGVRGWLRACPRLRLHLRNRLGAVRAARDASRHHPGLRRHAAARARRGSRARQADHSVGHALRCPAGARLGSRERGRGGRLARRKRARGRTDHRGQRAARRAPGEAGDRLRSGRGLEERTCARARCLQPVGAHRGPARRRSRRPRETNPSVFGAVGPGVAGPCRAGDGSMRALPRRVRITEVGMRDGLQMEPLVVATERKIEIGLALIEAGVRDIEATSFVSTTAVPQLADAAAVIAGLKGRGATLRALVPNANGARRAAAAQVDRMIVFMSASESHHRKNVRRSIAESLAGLEEIATVARGAGVALGGIVSTAFGCPYEGNVPLAAVARIVEAYAQVGMDEVSLGDTTGMATPPIVAAVVGGLRAQFPALPFALHFHNTRALGLVNVMQGLELGIDRYESSIGGLGGCPFAPGATGNVCTEDLLNMLNELGIETGMDLDRLIRVARDVERLLG